MKIIAELNSVFKSGPSEMSLIANHYIFNVLNEVAVVNFFFNFEDPFHLHLKLIHT